MNMFFLIINTPHPNHEGNQDALLVKGTKLKALKCEKR